jgi:DNA-binding CsgD family transcriptional regulator
MTSTKGSEMPDPFSRLTDGQKACLRLVARGRSSKQIAQETGLSHRTIDQYIFKATSALGASDRRDAARKFEGWELLKKLELKSEAVASPAESGELASSAQREGWQQSQASPSSMHDGGAIVSAHFGKPDGFFALPPIGGKPNTLSLRQRFYSVLRIAGFSAIAMLALVLITTGMLSLYT